MRKKKKLWLIPVIVIPVLIIVIVAAVLIVKAVMKNLPGTGVELVAVEERDLSETLTLKGTLSGETVTNVTSKATAEVVELKVQVGDKVKKGDVLCILDSEDIGKKLEQANESLSKNNAISSLENRQGNTALANAREDQARSLEEAQKAIDKAQADYNKAVNEVNNNSDTLSSNQSKLKKLEKALKTTGEALVKVYNSATNSNVTSPDEIATEPSANDSWSKEYEAYVAAAKEYGEKAEKYATKIAECKGQTKILEQTRDSAAELLEMKKNAYNETKIQTERAIESAKNSIETRKYTSDNRQFTEAVESLEEQYEACTITAPVDGVVTAVNVAVGDIVMSERTVITIEDGDNMKLVLTVDEKNILKLTEGIPATITNDYMPDTEIKGSVSRVVKVKSQTDPVAQTAAGYPVEISFKNNGDFLLGMSGKAKITLSERGTGLAVPYDLVKKDEDGKSYILLAKDNKNGTYTAYKEYFTPGDEIEYYVEVKEGNIKAGDLIPNNPMIMDGATFPASTDYFLTTEGDKK